MHGFNKNQAGCNLSSEYSGLFNESSKNIRTFPFMGHDLHVVDGKSASSLRLLEQAYNQVYTKAFPIEEERDSLDVWHNILQGNVTHTELVIVIAGEKLGTSDQIIKAVSVAEYYPAADAGLLRFNAVGEDYRGQSLGRVMVEARKNALLDTSKSRGLPLGGIFTHCNDPAKIKPEQDVMDPATRIKIFESYGAKKMPFDCLLPPLLPGYPPCDFLQLLCYPHPTTNAYPAKDATKRYMHAIYINLDESQAPEKNPDYIEVLKRIDNMPWPPKANAPTQKPSL